MKVKRKIKKNKLFTLIEVLLVMVLITGCGDINNTVSKDEKKQEIYEISIENVILGANSGSSEPVFRYKLITDSARN